MMKPGCEREALMQRVQSCGFAFDEAQLFLDTHPCDQVALAQAAEYERMYRKAVEIFTEKVGPLTAKAAAHCEADRWNWIDCPWPWEA